MATLPDFRSPTVDAIYAAYQTQYGNETPRGHLGASQIGHPCRRFLWLQFRLCFREQFSGRMHRLFETGKLEEPRVVNDLRAISCTVHAVDPQTGRQFWFGDHGGHFSGSMDGAVQGLPEAPKAWHVLEIKTHSAKSFALLKHGGIQVAKPRHLDQLQTYMGWSGMERACYFAVCKDTDEIYVERVAFDEQRFQAIRVRALMIIEAKAPPEMVEIEQCKWCPAFAVCRGTVVPPVNCRTCTHCAAQTSGRGSHWTCGFDHHDIPFLLQLRGCDHHLFIPELLSFAHEVDGGDGFIVYQRGGHYFVNASAASFPACTVPHYTSRDMEKLEVEELGVRELA